MRSTMCVPPCDCGVKPIPARPESRPECMRIRPTSDAERMTWMTAKTASMAGGIVASDPVNPDEARQKIHDLIVTGDNRLKQGVSPEKVRQTYDQALALATEHGLDPTIRPLIEVRLADLERLAGGSPPPEPPAG